MYVGQVIDGLVKEVKGITYSLDQFLGPDLCDSREEEELEFIRPARHRITENLRVQSSRAKKNSDLEEDVDPTARNFPRKGNQLYCVVMYLSPGDYHHFHSPAEWTASLQRHFHGKVGCCVKSCKLDFHLLILWFSFGTLCWVGRHWGSYCPVTSSMTLVLKSMLLRV